MGDPTSVIDTIFFISEDVNKGGVQLFEASETNIHALSSFVSGDCSTKINIDSFAYLLQHLLNSKPVSVARESNGDNDKEDDISDNFDHSSINIKKIFYIARSQNSTDELYIVKDDSQTRFKESENISKLFSEAKKVPKDDIIMLINALLGDSNPNNSRTENQVQVYKNNLHNSVELGRSINNTSTLPYRNVNQTPIRQIDYSEAQYHNDDYDQPRKDNQDEDLAHRFSNMNQNSQIMQQNDLHSSTINETYQNPSIAMPPNPSQNNSFSKNEFQQQNRRQMKPINNVNRTFTDTAPGSESCRNCHGSGKAGRSVRCKECEGCQASKCGNCKTCMNPKMKKPCLQTVCKFPIKPPCFTCSKGR